MEPIPSLASKNLVTRAETLLQFPNKNLKLMETEKNGGLLKTGDVEEGAEEMVGRS